MEYWIDTALDTALDPEQESRLAEIAHTTDVITVVLTSIVILTNIVAIILIIVMHIQSRRPKNISERFKSYMTTMGTVVSVEKVAYHIKRFVKKDGQNDAEHGKKSGDASSPVEKYTDKEVVFKSPDKVEKESDEILKYRYKVLYEFTITENGTNEGNLYTGECYVYKAGEVKRGDLIEVTYKPDDPMINFTDYSMPAGFLTKNKGKDK